MTAGRSHHTAELMSSTELPRHEAERLLRAVTGLGRADLLLGADVTPAQVEQFDELVRRRSAGEPLQYLEGTVQFGPLELLVDPRVLIPRPETEQLWEIVTGSAGEPRLIVDLCTGSGNLALALKHAWPEAKVYGTDVDARALEVAEMNARNLQLDVWFLHGDLFDPLPEDLRGAFDLVVANPPYVADGDFLGLPADVRDHEPSAALLAGSDGLDVLRRIAAEAVDWLGPERPLFCEIGSEQGPAVLQLFSAYGAHVLSDTSGRPRFLSGRRTA